MEKKRMRVFAGPNGSGKSTILKKILEEKRVRLGVYVNADDIESALRQTKAIKFSDYKLQVSETELRDFFKRSNFAPVKRNDPHLWTKVFVDDNVFRCDVSVDSYLAADVAEFIRQRLLSIGASFTYETVMSHPGKVEFLNHAIQQGYRVYLYYIATEDPDINISRVNVRVAQDGHPVSESVIRRRFTKSLENLKSAVRNTTRAYIFDNSQSQVQFIAEIQRGVDVALNTAVGLPYWVATYLLEPSQEES